MVFADNAPARSTPSMIKSCTQLLLNYYNNSKNFTLEESKGRSMASDESATPPAKTKASLIDESPMVALMYVKSIPKISYKQWLADKNKRVSPVKPAASLDDMDPPTKRRHDISYICESFLDWSNLVNREGCPIMLPTLQKVQEATEGSVPLPIDYDRDGLIWLSDI
jgi:hypothetical protein